MTAPGGVTERDAVRPEPRRKRRGEQLMVPEARFRSYYGLPILKQPVWRAFDIAGYFFLGGLAGASSVLGAGAHLTGRRRLARASKVGALGAISLSTVALVHDLGRPERFANMLRTFKLTSPMSVGSWVLAGYGPMAGAAAATAVTGRLPRAGAAATAGAAVLGPLVATYTAALLSDTAIPAWHDGYREMPFVFAGSAATAAGGLGLLAVPVAECTPARRLALVGAVTELAAERMTHRMGAATEPYTTGKAKLLMTTGQVLTVVGLVGAFAGRRSRLASAASGAALLGASAATRFGIFQAGRQSAADPRYVVEGQKERSAR